MGELLKDVWSLINNLRCSKNYKNKHGKIKVLFLCQMGELWNKMASVYLEMKASELFETYLLCIPSNCTDYDTSKPNETYIWFRESGFYEAIDALSENGKFLDLRELDLDYVFYQRPYDNYLPKCYRSYNICKYARICMINYGIILAHDFIPIVMKRKFFQNVYFFFGETEYLADFNMKRFSLCHKYHLKKSVFIGVPALESMIASKNIANNFDSDIFKVIWTPRWTTDLKIGGSNFLRYYLKMLSFFKKHIDMNLLIRPHPLMIDNFIKNHHMTENEVNSFYLKVKSADNICLDNKKDYINTFWESDVLVTDFSSIIAEYFITGKPIVYCSNDADLKYTEDMLKMLECCYVVDNEEDMFKCILEIRNGNDYLKEKRKTTSDEIFGKIEQSSKRIVDALVEDYFER